MRLLIPVVLAAGIIGCGSSSGHTPTSAAPPQVAAPTAGTTTTSASHLAQACSPRARATLARAASVATSSVRAKPFTASSGAESCHLQSSGGDLDVVSELDSAPQPYFRMEREQVEFWQNVEWSHKTARASPRPVKHLGLDGYWFPLQSRLLTTDGVRLVMVKVRSGPTGDPTEREAIATRLARVYLGPNVKPPGY